MSAEVAVLANNTVQKEALALLAKKGVSCIGIEANSEKNVKDTLANCKIIVLPFPSTRTNIAFLRECKVIGDYFLPEHTVIGGMINAELKDEFEKSGIKFYDYFENEAYVLKNAQLTSQGAVRLLLENTPDFLVGKKVLVTGFGRIGKSLAMILKSLGMKVFIAVRREESAVEVLAMGFDVFNFNAVKGTLFYYDYIFNTVPSMLLSYRDISHLNENAIYFELASSPFGADKKNFELLGKNYIHGGALPGRYYQKAVARNIVDYILDIEGGSYE